MYVQVCVVFLPAKVAELSNSFGVWLLDTSGGCYPLPLVDGDVLCKLLEYVNKRAKLVRKAGEEKSKNSEAILKGWDEEFTKDLGQAMIFELMLVSDSCSVSRFNVDDVSPTFRKPVRIQLVFFMLLPCH